MRRISRQEGQAVVESAIVFPMMLFTILGTLQLTMMQQSRLMAEYAAFSAARVGAVWNMDTERMTNAAIIGLLPTYPTSPGSAITTSVTGLACQGVRVDNVQCFAANYARVWLENKVTEKFGQPMIKVDVLNPTKEDFGGKKEIEFDNIGSGSLDDRRKTQLTIRLTYMYELKLPVVNWMMFETWLASRAGVDLHGYNPLLPEAKKGFIGVKTTQTARIAGMMATAGDQTCSWSGVNKNMLLTLGAVAVAFKQYFIPIVTTHTIRMQSNPFEKFAAAKNSGC